MSPHFDAATTTRLDETELPLLVLFLHLPDAEDSPFSLVSSPPALLHPEALASGPVEERILREHSALFKVGTSPHVHSKRRANTYFSARCRSGSSQIDCHLQTSSISKAVAHSNLGTPTASSQDEPSTRFCASSPPIRPSRGAA